MKKRETIILVVLAHVGLILIWLTMGGCTLGRGTPGDDEMDVTGVDIPDEEELFIPDSDSELIINDTPLEFEAEEPLLTTAGETEYVIKPGDTLWKISGQCNVSVKEIKERNNLQSDMIRAGEILILPRTRGFVAPAPAPSTEKIEEPKVEGLSEVVESGLPSGEYIEHVVVAGDTIWDLAKKYNTTSAKIQELNNITDPRQIKAGDKLKIPQQ